MVVAPLIDRMEDKVGEIYLGLDASYYRLIMKGMVVPLPEAAEHLAKEFRKPPYSFYKPASSQAVSVAETGTDIEFLGHPVPRGGVDSDFLEAVSRAADMVERELARWPEWSHCMKMILLTRVGLDPEVD